MARIRPGWLKVAERGYAPRVLVRALRLPSPVRGASSLCGRWVWGLRYIVAGPHRLVITCSVPFIKAGESFLNNSTPRPLFLFSGARGCRLPCAEPQPKSDLPPARRGEKRRRHLRVHPRRRRDTAQRYQRISYLSRRRRGARPPGKRQCTALPNFAPLRIKS